MALGFVEVVFLFKEVNFGLKSLNLFSELNVDFSELFFLILSLSFFKIDGIEFIGQVLVFLHNLLKLDFKLLDFGFVGSFEFKELELLLVFLLLELFL